MAKLTESTTDQLIAIAAHRYCLGRRSYIVGACVEWLRDVWPDLTPQTRGVVIRDTRDALERGEAGDCMDEQEWAGFLAWAESQPHEEAL